MKALVVYESMYGNRAAVASAIADGLAASGVEVRAWPVTEVDATEVAEAGLLVIGGPTHAHGMTWATTRKTAASDKKNALPHPTVEPGLREWIDELPDVVAGQSMNATPTIRGMLTAKLNRHQGVRLLDGVIGWRGEPSSPAPKGPGASGTPDPCRLPPREVGWLQRRGDRNADTDEGAGRPRV
jgi:hypothetical protein